MVFPLVTGIFFNAIWLVVRRVFTMLRSDRELPVNLGQGHLEEFNLGATDIEQPISPRDLVALTATRISTTEQEL